jgi:hypothetical protein
MAYGFGGSNPRSVGPMLWGSSKCVTSQQECVAEQNITSWGTKHEDWLVSHSPIWGHASMAFGPPIRSCFLKVILHPSSTTLGMKLLIPESLRDSQHPNLSTCQWYVFNIYLSFFHLSIIIIDQSIISICHLSIYLSSVYHRHHHLSSSSIYHLSLYCLSWHLLSFSFLQENYLFVLLPRTK